MLDVMVELNFAITLLEGWLQADCTVGKSDSPQKESPTLGVGLVHESCVHRKVTRLDLLISQSGLMFHSLQLSGLLMGAAQLKPDELSVVPLLPTFGNG